jgi:hypothetical protein
MANILDENGEFTYLDTCTLCGDDLCVLGVLGHTEHLYCRACGAEFHQPVVVTPAEPSEAEEEDNEGMGMMEKLFDERLNGFDRY